MRPRQWIKNGFVAGPLLFSGQFSDLSSVLLICLAMLLFSLASGAVYLLNDVRDLDADRLHPTKQLRPVARGDLPPGVALATAVGLCGISLALAFIVNVGLFLSLGLYLGITTLYSLALKRVPLLDVVIIACGFVLRVIAGAAAIEVEASAWILLCTGLLALLLGFGKRRHELDSLRAAASAHRAALSTYSTPMLTWLCCASGGATVAAYSAYAIVGPGSEHHAWVTIPLVAGGITRYLWLLLRRDAGGNPTEIAWTDRPLIIIIGVWTAVSVALLAS